MDQKLSVTKVLEPRLPGIDDFVMFFFPAEGLVPLENRILSDCGGSYVTLGGHKYVFVYHSNGLVNDPAKCDLREKAFKYVKENPGSHVFKYSYKDVKIE